MCRLQNESESEAGAWLARDKTIQGGGGGKPNIWIRLLYWGTM